VRGKKKEKRCGESCFSALKNGRGLLKRLEKEGCGHPSRVPRFCSVPRPSSSSSEFKAILEEEPGADSVGLIPVSTEGDEVESFVVGAEGRR